MIVIQIESEVVSIIRRFKSDMRSVTFLKRMDKLHNTHRESLAGPKPKSGKRAIEKWKSDLGSRINVKINITHE